MFVSSAHGQVGNLATALVVVSGVAYCPWRMATSATLPFKACLYDNETHTIELCASTL